MILISGAIAALVFGFSAQAKVSNDSQSMSRCSTAQIEPLDQILVENQLNFLRAKRNFKSFNPRAQAVTHIPVHYHVFAKSDQAFEGNVSDEVLVEQIEVLNKAYASSNIVFEVASVNRKIDEVLYDFVDEEKIKAQNHQGGAGELNFYIAAPGGGGILGWATFPWEYQLRPHLDGIVIHFDTLPGGALQEYNLGATAVHEAGHWLGLYHTFQGGCIVGDRVDDTAAEFKANFGCPTEAPDTCDDAEGHDPIHNFMDYSDDICLDHFTHGQIQRMHDNIVSYRSQSAS